MNKRYCIIPVFVSHKGCPHDCIFCNQRKIAQEERDISAYDVKSKIDSYLSTMDRDKTYVELSFFGGSFTGISIDYQNELLEAAKGALDDGKIDDIRLSTRPDYINGFILDNLKRYGVGVIELGVQSMSNEVLYIAERGHSPEDVIEASKLIKEYGFKLGLQMMTGLPGDTLEKDLYTAREIIKLKPDFVRIYPALVIKDTYMEYMYRSGTYKPLELDEAIAISKALYKEFTNANIPIIRMGLQATEKIAAGRDVVAGPFHPSFRELVESSLLNDMMEYVIEKYYAQSDKIVIDINPLDISKLYAGRKRFFNKKISKYTTKNIKIRQNSIVTNMQLSFNDGKIGRNMSIYQFLKIKE